MCMTMNLTAEIERNLGMVRLANETLDVPDLFDKDLQLGLTGG